MAKKLNEMQIAAIAILSQPKRGGLTPYRSTPFVTTYVNATLI